MNIINPTPRPRFNKMHGFKRQCHCPLRPNFDWQMWCENGFFVDNPGEVFVQLERINERSLRMFRYALRKTLRRMSQSKKVK